MSKSTSKETENQLSVVAAYDDLVRNSAILSEGSEKEFLKFVVNSEVSRQRWEHAELECQRLSIELTKCSQDINSMEHKLNHARAMLDTELHLRKKAEAERDRLASQLQVLRQLVMDTDHHGLDEVTMDKIRSLDRCGVRTNTNILSPGLTREAMDCRRSAINLTEASVLDVEDLSFDVDDTLGLCESRTRGGTTFNKQEQGVQARKKRSRSAGRRSGLPVVVENVSKRGRRSCSVGVNDNNEVEKLEPRVKARRSVVSEGRGRRSSNIRGNSRRSTVSNNSRGGKEEKENIKQGQDVVGEEHTLVERTVIKPEKCMACSKRIKFGKICLKCLHCKVPLHMECRDMAGTCTVPSPTKVSSLPIPSLYTTPSKRASIYLTPSKKENKNTIFSSPMLR
eukprot:TRINITY_DN37296_c0_g1_i1.p1 TRINITY_DN37296_c0_g1~~TRINITY_DN37296_c0_g1_i1.p1  ORF type:complete len:396 (+),score=168.31 TRINITY_DN37296_c0_g1_i1:117-1304(+)